MKKNDSDSSLIQPPLPFFIDWRLPAINVGISEGDWLGLNPLLDSHTLSLHLDDMDRVQRERLLPEYFIRPIHELWKAGRVESPFVETHFEPHQFDVMSFNAPLSTQTLDNTPVLEPYQTWLNQAFASQANFWRKQKDGGLVPLDWGAFVLLLRANELGEEKFLSLIDNQYHRYSKITLVFADVIYGGRDRQRLYLIWTLKRKKEGFECGFRICQDFVYQLGKGETFITACIPRSAVEFPEKKRNPKLFTESEARVSTLGPKSVLVASKPESSGAASLRTALLNAGVEGLREIPLTDPRPA